MTVWGLSVLYRVAEAEGEPVLVDPNGPDRPIRVGDSVHVGSDRGDRFDFFPMGGRVVLERIGLALYPKEPGVEVDVGVGR